MELEDLPDHVVEAASSVDSSAASSATPRAPPTKAAPSIVAIVAPSSDASSANGRACSVTSESAPWRITAVHRPAQRAADGLDVDVHGAVDHHDEAPVPRLRGERVARARRAAYELEAMRDPSELVGAERLEERRA